MDKLRHKWGVVNAERLQQYELHHNKCCARKATPSPSPPVQIEAPNIETHQQGHRGPPSAPTPIDNDSPEIIGELEQPKRRMGRGELEQLIGRRVEETPGDGNCLLHSYIRGVQQRNKKLQWRDGKGFDGCTGHDEVLQKHLRGLVSHKLETCHFCKELPECAEEEARRIEKDKEWFNEATIRALAIATNTDIFIFSPDGTR